MTPPAPVNRQPLKMYDDRASWWPLLSPPEEYEEEAEFYRSVLDTHGDPTPRSLLELGSGGGNNASFLKHHFEMVLVDLSPGMIARSRDLNPECDHVIADMRSVRLGRSFDRVFVHDAICYMTTEGELRQVMRTAYEHCRPGGAALFAPDHLIETFTTGTDHGGADGKHRGLRYLEWTHDPDPSDSCYTVDYAFLLRDESGTTRIEHDRHIEGVFSRERWMQLLAEVGFEPRSVAFPHSEVARELEVFVGVRRPNP